MLMTYFVIIWSVYVATHSKVGYFDRESVPMVRGSGAGRRLGAFTDQAVPARQITVHEMMRRQVRHSVGYLLGDRMQINLIYHYS